MNSVVKALTRPFYYILMVLASFLMIFPIAWTVVTSLRPDAVLFTYPPQILAPQFSLVQYDKLFYRTHFSLYLQNSLTVAAAATVFSVICSTLAAYSLTRFQYRFKGTMAQVLLTAYLLPPILIIVPLFVIFTWIGLADTLAGLMIGHVTFICPFALWLLYSFFRSIPPDLEEAAMVDGLGRLRAFWHTTLRLAMPGIVAAALYAFVLSWNDYLFAFSLITTEPKRTLALVAVGWATTLSLDYGLLMALCVMINVPSLILLLLFKERLLKGAGFIGVKG